MSMFGFSAFKTRKPRDFDYRPRYFDPEKEAREERRREVLGEKAFDDGDKEYKPGMYIGELRMRRGIIADRRQRAKSRAGSMRLVIFIVLVVVLAVYYFSR